MHNYTKSSNSTRYRRIWQQLNCRGLMLSLTVALRVVPLIRVQEVIVQYKRATLKTNKCPSWNHDTPSQNIFSRVEYDRHIKTSIENYCYKCIETSLSNYLFLCHFKNLGLNYTVWSWPVRLFSVFLLCYPYCDLVRYVHRISIYIYIYISSI